MSKKKSQSNEPAEQKSGPMQPDRPQVGAAFPVHRDTMQGMAGMNYREYVAAHAMAGIMATDNAAGADVNRIASRAVDAADALIARLAQ